MTQSFDLGGESNSFAFDTIGDRVEGLVVDMTERQSNDMDTGEPAYWPNGDKKTYLAVTLQTTLRDNEFDDGKRTVALSGSRKPETKSRMAAALKAIRAATGGSALQYGGRLTMEYVADEPPSKRGLSPRKLYEAEYKPPSKDLSGSKTGAVVDDSDDSNPPF